MKTPAPLFLTFSLILFLTVACSPKATPDPNAQIQRAVAATLAALPTATRAAPPTPFPSPTPFSLAGLFCEYQFCIGHPIDVSFFDISAQKNPASPSTYSQGLLAAFNGNLFIQVIWQIAPQHERDVRRHRHHRQPGASLRRRRRMDVRRPRLCVEGLRAARRHVSRHVR
ncbi:MAG: hypothetical protein HUU12_07295 [Anaerolineales bacterium]|nr:hypothetical protein [Anaerolineales bacterium]